jgi:hemerythrin-like domain-containing protein
MTTRHEDLESVIETKLVHDVQRRSTTMLADAVGRPDVPPEALVRMRDFLVAELDHHHRSEDDDLWPLLLDAAPDLAEPLGRLTQEHAQLDRVLDRLATTPLGDGEPAAREAAAGLRELVHGHLAHEEPVLFPALRAHVSAGAWDGFSQRTVQSTPQAGTDLLLELFYEVGDEDAVATVLRHLPDEALALIPAKRAEARPVLDALRAPEVAAG